MDTEGTYLCDACGEEIVIPLDHDGSRRQEYVEDCPVCCHANLIHVEWNGEQANVWASAEQDRF